MTDERKLKARIVEMGFTQVLLAKKLGISFQSLSNKLSNKTQFKSQEIGLLSELLKIKDKNAYFFVQSVDK